MLSLEIKKGVNTCTSIYYFHKLSLHHKGKKLLRPCCMPFVPEDILIKINAFLQSQITVMFFWAV